MLLLPLKIKGSVCRKVWVRFNGEVEDEDEMSSPQKTDELEDGSD